MGLLLFPDIRERIHAFVRFCPVDLASAAKDQAWPKLREWLVPDEPWEEPGDQPKASQIWPRELFTPLESLGISVTEEHYDSTKAFQAVHPDVRISA